MHVRSRWILQLAAAMVLSAVVTFALLALRGDLNSDHLELYAVSATIFLGCTFGALLAPRRAKNECDGS